MEKQLDYIMNTLYNKYIYVFKNQKEFLKFIRKNIGNKESEVDILELENLIKEYIAKKLKNDEYILKIMSDFVDRKFNNKDSSVCDKFKMLCTFFDDIEYFPKVEKIGELIKINRVFYEFVSDFVFEDNSGTLNSINEKLAAILTEAFKNVDQDDDDILENDDLGISPLSFKEERILGYRILDGDEDAKKIFIERNLKLVYKIAGYYSSTSRGLDYDDLVQEGSIGLMKAVDKFDVNLGCKFSTYATWWIRQAITRAISNDSRVIRLPVYKVEEITAYKKTCNALKHDLGREPDYDEIAKALNISRSEVIELENLNVDTVSLDTPINDDGNRTKSLEIFISSDDKSLESQFFSEELHDELLYVISNSGLSDRELLIIMERFGLKDGKAKTLEEVAKIFKVTRERVRQIESKAFVKLRLPKNIRRLKPYLND